MKNETAATVTSILLTISIALLSLDGPRWDALFGRRFRERKRLRVPLEKHYLSRPKNLYRFVPDLALRRYYPTRRQRFVERARRAEAIEVPRYEDGCLAARAWLATVGEFSRIIGVEEQLPLRRFMQTNHLALIREGLLVFPFIMSMHSQHLLSDDQVDQAAWGLALINAAARYNSLVPYQRQDVYFLDVVGLGPVGPILRSPSPWRRPVFSVLNRVQPQLKLRSFPDHFFASAFLSAVDAELVPRRVGPHHRR